MAAMRNKRNLAAVSRETPEKTRNNQSQIHKTHIIKGWLKSKSLSFPNKLKGGSLKKLSHEISRTESRILGALSELDEFLLNPQVRTCSVAVPGTSKNIKSENREHTGDRSVNVTCPEVVFSACDTSNLNDSEQEETYHSNCGEVCV